MQKLWILGVLSMLSFGAYAHPGHGESLLEEIFHTLSAADHLPASVVIGMGLATTALYVWGALAVRHTKFRLAWLLRVSSVLTAVLGLSAAL